MPRFQTLRRTWFLGRGRFLLARAASMSDGDAA